MFTRISIFNIISIFIFILLYLFLKHDFTFSLLLLNAILLLLIQLEQFYYPGKLQPRLNQIFQERYQIAVYGKHRLEYPVEKKIHLLFAVIIPWCILCFSLIFYSYYSIASIVLPSYVLVYSFYIFLGSLTYQKIIPGGITAFSIAWIFSLLTLTFLWYDNPSTEYHDACLFSLLSFMYCTIQLGTFFSITHYSISKQIKEYIQH